MEGTTDLPRTLPHGPVNLHLPMVTHQPHTACFFFNAVLERNFDISYILTYWYIGPSLSLASPSLAAQPLINFFCRSAIIWKHGCFFNFYNLDITN